MIFASDKFIFGNIGAAHQEACQAPIEEAWPILFVVSFSLSRPSCLFYFFCSLQDNSKHLSTNQKTNRQRSPVNCTTGICDMREVTAENFSYINKQVAVSSFVVGLHYRKPQKRILGTECCELRIFILNIMQNPMMN